MALLCLFFPDVDICRQKISILENYIQLPSKSYYAVNRELLGLYINGLKVH